MAADAEAEAEAEEMRVRLIREAGGLGDVLCCLAVARSIRLAVPDVETWFYAMPGYAPLPRACPDVDRVVAVPNDERIDRDVPINPREYPHLDRADVTFDASVNLFCPAFRHEADSRGRPTLNRIQAMCRYAAGVLGVDLEPVAPRIVLKSSTRAYARGAIDGACGGPDYVERPMLGIHPFAMAQGRAIGAEHLAAVLRELARVGARAFYLRDRWTPRNEWQAATLKTFRGAGVPGVDPPDHETLAAAVAACDVFLCGDSGPMHLAGCLGVPTVGLFGLTSGEMTCRQYGSHAPLDPTPEMRDGLPCDHACYRLGSAGWDYERCGGGCGAQARIPAGAVAEAVVRLLEATFQ